MRSRVLPTRVEWLSLVLVVAVGAALRFYDLGSEPFWLDEAHSARFMRLPVGDLWSWEHPYDRGNPPGYIFLLKAWSQVSGSDSWLRSLSVLAGVATLPLVYLTGRRIASHRSALVATAFLALSGYHLRFSQEARAYALVGLVAAGVMLAVTWLMTKPEGASLAWPSYSLLAGGAFLLHNTAAGILIAANLAVVWWWLRSPPRPPRFARKWVIANLAALGIWATWLPGFISQMREVGRFSNIPPPTVLLVAQGGADLLVSSLGWRLPWNEQAWPAVALVVGALILIWWGTRTLATGPRALLWSFLLTLPLIEIVFSFRQPIFLTRTLIWTLIPASLGLGLAATKPKTWWPATSALLIVVSALGAGAYHATYQKTAWDEAALLVAELSGAGDVVMIQPGFNLDAFNHYSERLGLDIPVVAVPTRIPDRVSSGSNLTASDRAQVADLAEGYGTVWLILNRPPEGQSLEETLAPLALDEQRYGLYDLTVVRYSINR